MTQINIKNLTFGYTENLIEEFSATITENDSIGIVGNNGEGKSTLLKCISGIISDYKGEIIKARNLSCVYLAQDTPDHIRGVSVYEAALNSLPESEKNYNSWKADAILEDFKIPYEFRDYLVSELSGGWQRIVSIACAAICEPDIFLCDEPTNHLDVQKIIFLENWFNEHMRNVPKIIISHDRKFLDNCTNRTFFLRQTKISDYKYSYSKAKDLLIEDDKANCLQRERELEELNRLKKSAHNLRQMGVNNFSDRASQKAKQTEKKIEKLQSQVTEVHKEKRRDIRLSNSDTHAKRMLLVQNSQVSSPNGNVLFKIEKLEIKRGERVVILGENGSGKTQLLKLLKNAFSNIEDFQEHGISITPTAKLGYIDQLLSDLPLKKSIYEYIREVSEIDQQSITSLLVTAGFPYTEHETKISKLSQGQKSRLHLLALRLIKPNFYIMDEPTNHLDIAGQELLENEIIENEASSILVSHDRAFIQNLGSKFYMIDKKKLIEIKNPNEFYHTLGLINDSQN